MRCRRRTSGERRLVVKGARTSGVGRNPAGVDGSSSSRSATLRTGMCPCLGFPVLSLPSPSRPTTFFPSISNSRPFDTKIEGNEISKSRPVFANFKKRVAGKIIRWYFHTTRRSHGYLDFLLPPKE